MQGQRITPGEALNHTFVHLTHLINFGHCNNVRESLQMMEVCRRNGGSAMNGVSYYQPAQPSPSLMGYFGPSTSGSSSFMMESLLSNQVHVRDGYSGCNNGVVPAYRQLPQDNHGVNGTASTFTIDSLLNKQVRVEDRRSRRDSLAVAGYRIPGPSSVANFQPRITGKTTVFTIDSILSRK